MKRRTFLATVAAICSWAFARVNVKAAPELYFGPFPRPPGKRLCKLFDDYDGARRVVDPGFGKPGGGGFPLTGNTKRRLMILRSGQPAPTFFVLRAETYQGRELIEQSYTYDSGPKWWAPRYIIPHRWITREEAESLYGGARGTR